ncbi:MAG: D-alanyl-D-alanine carboxypeptidase family protein [Candidatus Sumerlaeaceae bacterium]
MSGRLRDLVFVGAVAFGVATGAHEQGACAASARKPAASTDVGVLVLPVRPAGKSAQGQVLRASMHEDDPVVKHAQTAEAENEGAAGESLSTSDRKVVPTFYGDFAPASRMRHEEVQAPPQPSAAPKEESTLASQAPEEHRSATPSAAQPVAGSTTLLSYERTREIFRELVPSATTFVTDHRRRPANCPIPLTLRGKGFDGRDLPIGQEDPYRDRLPPNFMPTDLVLLPAEYCYASQPIYLRREAAESLLRMIRDAQRQGLTLRVVSGYRDYSHQERLYRQNGGRRGARTVGRPGKSEHMLGTTVDFTSTERFLLKPSFATTPEGKWLARNAQRYGWKLTVVSGNRVIEPWHFRYFGSALGKSVASVPRDGVVRRALDNATAPVRGTLAKPLRAAERLFGSMFKK